MSTTASTSRPSTSTRATSSRPCSRAGSGVSAKPTGRAPAGRKARRAWGKSMSAAARRSTSWPITQLHPPLGGLHDGRKVQHRQVQARQGEGAQRHVGHRRVAHLRRAGHAVGQERQRRAGGDPDAGRGGAVDHRGLRAAVDQRAQGAAAGRGRGSPPAAVRPGTASQPPSPPPGANTGCGAGNTTCARSHQAPAVPTPRAASWARMRRRVVTGSSPRRLARRRPSAHDSSSG